MKKIRFIIFSVLVMFLIGCNNEVNDLNDYTIDDIESPNEVQMKDEIDSEFSTTIRISRSDVLKLIDKFTNGINKMQVVDRLGDDYKEIINSNGVLIWRFDIDKKDDYFIDDKKLEVDVNGLIDGLLQMQLFITWSEDERAILFELYYYDDSDEIHSYVLQDGGEKVTIYNPTIE